MKMKNDIHPIPLMIASALRSSPYPPPEPELENNLLSSFLPRFKNLLIFLALL